MIDFVTIKASLTSSGNHKEAFEELNDRELRDLLDETDSDNLVAAIHQELANRAKRSSGGYWRNIVWLLVFGLAALSVYAVVPG